MSLSRTKPCDSGGHLEDRMSGLRIKDVKIYSFQRDDGTPMGNVGIHPDGRVFVSARLHPDGQIEAAQASTEAGHPVVWHTDPDDLIPYCDATWMLEQVRARGLGLWQESAITNMIAAVRRAHEGERGIMSF